MYIKSCLFLNRRFHIIPVGLIDLVYMEGNKRSSDSLVNVEYLKLVPFRLSKYILVNINKGKIKDLFDIPISLLNTRGVT